MIAAHGIESYAWLLVAVPLASSGLLLVGGYLFFDGFTSTFQERLFKGYTMSTYNQMLYVNICSAILSFCSAPS